MIASNYRKHPEALALQWPLPFSRLLVWALPRPTTRILRAIRVARGAAFKLAGHIAYAVKASTPQWVKDLTRKAKALAESVKAALLPLPFATEPRIPHIAVNQFIAARRAALEQETGRRVGLAKQMAIRAEAYEYAHKNPHLFYR